MHEDKLMRTLRQIKVLASECLKEAGRHPSRHKEAGRKLITKASSAKTLPSHVLRLRDEGFFGQPKTASETRGKLQPVYPCDLDRVAMALLRLQRRKELRKASKIVNKSKQVAYVW
jgi:hypothetical protein